MRLRRFCIVLFLSAFSFFNLNSDEAYYSTYPIYVDRLEGAEELIEDLKVQDLFALLYEPDFPCADSATPTPEDSRSIWLGCYVPFDIAIAAIRTSYKHFPFLTYIYVNESDCPEEVKYEIFIGGSTRTAESYDLSLITAADFGKSAQSFKNIDELHRFIKSHYPSDDTVL
jgi:hypothetical protein